MISQKLCGILLQFSKSKIQLRERELTNLFYFIRSQGLNTWNSVQFSFKMSHSNKMALNTTKDDPIINKISYTQNVPFKQDGAKYN